MLRGIPTVLSPDLLKVLMEMGHGDELVLADGNFPAASHAKRLVRADGHGMLTLLDAILSLFPLDSYGGPPVALMAVVPGDTVQTPIWADYQVRIEGVIERPDGMEHIERFAFYERALKAYAVVATGESALYANLILRKGVVQ